MARKFFVWGKPLTVRNPITRNCLLVVLGFCLASGTWAKCLKGQAARAKTSLTFEQRMSAWVNLRFDEIELGQLIEQISREYDIAICLDRRVDPQRLVSVIIKDQSLRQAAQQLAESAQLTVVTIGETIFLSPDARASLMAARVRQLEAELKGPPLQLSARRTVQLLTPVDVTWADFTTTTEILSSLESRGPLRLAHHDYLAEDVLAGRSLSQVNQLESLALFVFQFGCDIRLTPAADRELATCELIDLPSEAQMTSELASFMPEKSPGTTRRVVPLAKREFTLQVSNARARDVLQAIIDSGVAIVYDEASLTTHGVDLNASISLLVSKADVNELMRQICQPLGAEYTIVGEEIWLRPARR